MPDRRYEVRVTGRLPDVAQATLAADVAEVAAETVISGLVRHDQGLHQSSLATVQKLGLRIMSVQLLTPEHPPR
jgi:hypothetical protein